MRIQIGAAALLLLFAGSSEAAPGGCGNAASLSRMGFEEIDVSSTAKGFTSGVAYPDGVQPAMLAVCYVEDDAIRYRVDGLAPTASVGMLQPVSQSFSVCGTDNIKSFRMIRVTTDADVSCTYYRDGSP